MASTNEQLLGKTRTCAKLQIKILKTEKLIRVYTGKQSDKKTWLNRIRGKLKIPCLVYKNSYLIKQNLFMFKLGLFGNPFTKLSTN